MLGLKGSFYETSVLEPLWLACYFPRGNSLYSRNKHLLDLISGGKFEEIKESIEKSTSRDFKNPLLLKDILITAFKQQRSIERNNFIVYMLNLEPIISLTKMYPSRSLFRISDRREDGIIDYTSILNEAIDHKDPEILELVKNKFGIELIISSNIIERKIENYEMIKVKKILEMDRRFTAEEIQSIIDLREEEKKITDNMVLTIDDCEYGYSYKDDDNESKTGKALEMFLCLRNKKISYLSKMSFLPTYALYATKNLNSDSYATIAIAGVSACALLAYNAYNAYNKNMPRASL